MTEPTENAHVAPLTTGEKWLFSVLGAVSAGLAGACFWGMFNHVRDAMAPFAGHLAWLIPVGSDVGLLLAAVFSVIFEAKAIKCWWLRYATLPFIALQIGLNVGAAHGNPLGTGGSLALPAFYILIIEVWRVIFRWRRNLLDKTSRDRIPVARWFAACGDTRELRTFMILWRVNSYEDALGMRQQLRLAEARLKDYYGALWGRDVSAALLAKLHMPATMAEACAEIAKLVSGAKTRVQRTGPDEAAGRPAAVRADCCEAHRLLAAGQTIELSPETARALNEAHKKVHGSPMGADPLRLLFKIGTVASRQLRNRLAESGPAVGPVGSGQSGESGESGRDALVGSGSVNGSSGGGR